MPLEATTSSLGVVAYLSALALLSGQEYPLERHVKSDMPLQLKVAYIRCSGYVPLDTNSCTQRVLRSYRRLSAAWSCSDQCRRFVHSLRMSSHMWLAGLRRLTPLAWQMLKVDSGTSAAIAARCRSLMSADQQAMGGTAEKMTAIYYTQRQLFFRSQLTTSVHHPPLKNIFKNQTTINTDPSVASSSFHARATLRLCSAQACGVSDVLSQNVRAAAHTQLEQNALSEALTKAIFMGSLQLHLLLRSVGLSTKV